MEPNMFLRQNDCKEDFFSRSLAYICNLFPAIGQRLVQRISVLAGESPDFFGEFEKCEFVGQEFPDGHRISRPDLRIECTDGTIYFENKLDSPFSLSQLQRHLSFISGTRRNRLIFVSNVQYDRPVLQSLRGYLHPSRRDHYVWADFLPVFKNNFRKGTHAAKVLSDFREALRAQGMIGRAIKGANGSLYTRNSEASHLAFKQLWDLLDATGFQCVKKIHKEDTIRAYPVKIPQYPLLNPRFYSSGIWFGDEWDKECLIFTVLSKGDNPGFDRQFSKFRSSKDCTFIGNPDAWTGYYYHGHFILPLSFKGRASNEIDFAALAPALRRMLKFLKGCTT